MWYKIFGRCNPNTLKNPEILYAHALEAAAIPIKDTKVIVCPAKYPMNYPYVA